MKIHYDFVFLEGSRVYDHHGDHSSRQEDMAPKRELTEMAWAFVTSKSLPRDTSSNEDIHTPTKLQLPILPILSNGLLPGE